MDPSTGQYYFHQRISSSLGAEKPSKETPQPFGRQSFMRGRSVSPINNRKAEFIPPQISRLLNEIASIPLEGEDRRASITHLTQKTVDLRSEYGDNSRLTDFCNEIFNQLQKMQLKDEGIVAKLPPHITTLLNRLSSDIASLPEERESDRRDKIVFLMEKIANVQSEIEHPQVEAFCQEKIRQLQEMQRKIEGHSTPERLVELSETINTLKKEKQSIENEPFQLHSPFHLHKTRHYRAYEVQKNIDDLEFLKRRLETQPFLSATLGVPIDQQREYAIPQKIHRFWSGGKMSDHAMKILKESAEKTSGTSWKNTLWYSAQLEQKMDSMGIVDPVDQKKREEQREELRHLGYDVRPIESLAIRQEERVAGQVTESEMDEFTEKAIAHLKEDHNAPFEGIKWFSDLARLLYLYEVGGHHFDVDIGLGEMDFSREYYHNDLEGKIPLLGGISVDDTDPIAAEVKAVNSIRDRDLGNAEVAAAAKNVVERARDFVNFFNPTIATRAGNNNFREAIESLRESNLIPGPLSSGMTVNRLLLRSEEGNQADILAIQSQTVPPYVLDIQHFTSESRNR